jgi:retron-type reverse transcriptase
MKKYYCRYKDIITIANLLQVWRQFLLGKSKRNDVVIFQAHLMNNLFDIYEDLDNKTYRHGPYVAFNVADPKPRRIHKATVRDRVIHHLLYQALCDHFDSQFVFDSYSCRKNKGAHKALNRFKYFAGQVSRNHTRTCYVLKGDIRKFFASIDQQVLLSILRRQIADTEILWLIEKVLASFNACRPDVGLPLGNLTSQLFSNIYLNELDRYIKQELRIKYYIRYADDFVILSDNKNELEYIIPLIKDFLSLKLKLELHPQKLFIKTYASGVDFLGWVHFPHHRQIRTVTKKRIFRQMAGWPKPETVNSYRGLLGHGDTYKVRKQLRLTF